MGTLILIAILLTASIIIYQSDPWLWKRFFSLFRHFNDPTYIGLEPTEPISSPQPFIIPHPTTETQTISAKSLRTVEDYAAQFDSFSLIVLHRRQIQTEWYAPDWHNEQLTQSQSMHKTILPILLGIATEEGNIGSLVIVRMGPFAGSKPLKDSRDNSYIVNTLIKGMRKPV